MARLLRQSSEAGKVSAHSLTVRGLDGYTVRDPLPSSGKGIFFASVSPYDGVWQESNG